MTRIFILTMKKKTLKVNQETMKELDVMYQYNKKKHGNRKMSDEELRKLLGLK